MLESGEMLEAHAVSVCFKGVNAVNNSNIVLRKTELLGLIGPNGAGKTTLINVLSGYQNPTAGEVFLEGVCINGWPTYRIARSGIARTFQAVRLFPHLSVLENVEASMCHSRRGWRNRGKSARRILEMLNLYAYANARADSLDYGDERRVGIARALACNPKYLLLDEPAAGLNHDEIEALILMIQRIRDELQFGVLVVEHNMKLIMNLCERIVVLRGGLTIAEGTPEEIKVNHEVLEAYLGDKSE
jgi:branched-chain amino acid transport system ATP-binding protein